MILGVRWAWKDNNHCFRLWLISTCSINLQEKLFVKQVKKRKERQVKDKQKEEEMKENLAGQFRQQAYWMWLFST